LPNFQVVCLIKKRIENLPHFHEELNLNYRIMLILKVVYYRLISAMAELSRRFTILQSKLLV